MALYLLQDDHEVGLPLLPRFYVPHVRGVLVPLGLSDLLHFPGAHLLDLFVIRRDQDYLRIEMRSVPRYPLQGKGKGCLVPNAARRYVFSGYELAWGGNLDSCWD